MIINEDILRRDTVQLIKEIDAQIEEVTHHANIAGIQRHKLRDANGSWVMIPLLQAKAQAYGTLVQLQVKR
jgi:hypothetical protein